MFLYNDWITVLLFRPSLHQATLLPAAWGNSVAEMLPGEWWWPLFLWCFCQHVGTCSIFWQHVACCLQQNNNIHWGILSQQHCCLVLLATTLPSVWWPIQQIKYQIHYKLIKTITTSNIILNSKNSIINCAAVKAHYYHNNYNHT